MSRLEELIKEFCPNGVRCVTIGEICKISRGIVMSKDFIRDNQGDYPVYSSQTENNGCLGYINSYKYDGEYVTWTTDGANAGTVFYRSGKFSITNVCGLLEVKDLMIVNTKYLYYALSIEARRYVNQGMGNPKLMSNIMASVQIPLPALPVQREIVRILDSFTLYSAELTAELTARRKQYEYYRDKLLNFSSEIQFFTLGDVIISLNTGLNPRQFFHLNTPDAKNYYVTIRELQNGKIVFTDKTDKINDTALKLCNNRSNLEVGDVLFSGTGTIGTTAIIDKPPLNWNIKEGVYAIKPNKRKINSKFLMYLLQCQFVRDLYLSKAAGGTVQSVPMGEMKKLKIPVPPIEVQERIVKVLDNFDAICSDLGIGLPAEIEKRQKQYEYYREKLLTFDMNPATIFNGTERNGTERGLIRLLQYVYGFAFVRLGDIATIERGGNFQKKDFVGNGYPCIHYGQIYTKYGVSAKKTITFISNEVAKKSKIAKTNDIIMAVTSENVEDVCKCVAWIGNENVAVSGHTAIIHSAQNAKYLAYYFYTSMFFEQKRKYVHGTKVIEVTPSDLNSIIIPLPTLERQKEIVEILDKFDSICNDLSAGLPAEIEYRQKQYEYYRNKLLMFKDKFKNGEKETKTEKSNKSRRRKG